MTFSFRGFRVPRRLINTSLALAALLVTASVARAETRVASIFQDNMILQREKPVPVWGWADPGATINVSFAGHKKQATANDKGYWKAVLDPLAASKQGGELQISDGKTTIIRKNVQVGEVWIIAGQSNMVAGGKDLDDGVYPHYASPAKPDKPAIQLCSFGGGYFLTPQPDTISNRNNGSWELFKESPYPEVMAIPEYAARVIRDGLDVPVGIIRIAVPGTNQAAWMSRETLEKFPGENGKNAYQEFFSEREATLVKSSEEYPAWEKFEKAELEWKAKGNKQEMPVKGALLFANFPTALYNTRVYPLAPLAIRGVMWHQGEAGPRGPYDQRMVAMVSQWRELFGQDFYFLFGTLARHTANTPPLLPVRTSFYRSGTNTPIRHALELFGSNGKAALVELYDTGNNGTHWSNKAEAGRRFALAALTEVYGQKHLYSGPRMAETKITGNKATVRFTFVGDALVYEPSIDGISGVYLLGKDGKAKWGDVKIVGKDTIEVSHPEIAEIQTVAYADNPNPHETLFNSARLPASPFAVNPTLVRDAKPGTPIVAPVGGVANELHVAHVRRSGYMLRLGGEKTAPGNGALQAYIPAEWKGYEVLVDGKPVAAEEAVKDGAKMITFPVTKGAGWIIVCEKGKADAFSKVNRH